MDFQPHGFCLRWDGPLLVLHVVANGMIAFAYALIPTLLAYTAWRRSRDHHDNMLFQWLFGLFIVLCGATHVVDIIVLWRPYYWLQGCLAFATGLVSITVALTLAIATPAIIALPSLTELQAQKDQLVATIARLGAAEVLAVTPTVREQLHEAIVELEALVKGR